MGHSNQRIYLTTHLPRVEGPILEIGSHDYGSTAPFRGIYANNNYVGLDLQEGPNVDIVHDLTTGIGPLQPNFFSLAICCSVLEHVKRPWVMAEHITTLVRPGGHVYISVPWVWRYHAYPDDYFRFSHHGIRELFPSFEWQQQHYSLNVKNEFIKLTPETLNADEQLSILVPGPAGERKYLPYLMVEMLGIKLKD
ncbi:MAG: class I SAM-dependent methyltransferase [Pirellulales bacterium]|nr:class I SAM-dependent methyltransferase [Pirellulales bacterium]